jgi:isoleucyl-tRNA synthetase
VIFLATSQWFIAMDAKGLRERALEAISRIRWVPAWGEERIRGMVANRPDWCISRQRAWGVPIPAFDCASCREPVLTAELVGRTASVFERHGADAWYERPIEDFVPPGFTCPACGGTAFEREQNILDVWFDSGSSHEAVLGVHPDLRWPADLYLEGTDQYRGWFHSSLLVGLGTRNAPPYRAVLTHGFVVDEAGRKMSKSVGNAIEPQAVIARSGAEILRLWASMADFREEVRIGPEILARVVEAYRKLRNTCRILVANLFDFDPATDALPPGRLQELDRYALARYGEAARRVIQAYDEYDFPAIFQTLNALTTVDLSAFYIDVSKDRLYTLAPRSDARRSAQTAMYIIADGLARLIAPVLPVTADELWRHLPGEREASVHLSEFPKDDGRLIDQQLVTRWQRLIKVRDAVNVDLERLRQQKVIGTSLAAKVKIRTVGSLADLLERYRSELPTLFIASQAEVTRDEGLRPPANGDATVVHEHDSFAHIEVGRADGVKCERCWRYVPRVSSDPAHPGICERCEEALSASTSGS